MAYEKTYANGYTFAVDDTTGTIIATGELQNTMAERNQAVMAKTGGDMKTETDHAGHVIAARENGPCIPENLAAQDSKLNLSTYKKVENAEHRIMKDGGEIQTERIAYMSNPKTEQGVRPDCFMVNDKITYSDGNIQEVHLSFPNMTYGQQEGINRELENTILLDNSLNVDDTIRNEMSSQEYAQLIEETNKLLPNIGDEFEEQISYTPEIEEGVEVNTQNDWNFEAEQGMESDIQVENDWNFEAEADSDIDIGQSISDEVSSSVEMDSMDCSTDNSADIGGIDCGTDSSADVC